MVKSNAASSKYFSMSTSSMVENYLFNHQYLAMCIGAFIYIPCMSILFILCLVQIPITLSLNLCRRALPKAVYTPSSKLQPLSRSLITLLAPSDDTCAPCTVHQQDDEEISILSWNLFTFYGRFHSRMDLMKPAIEDADPDIVCVQEAVCSKWFAFGTANMIQNILSPRTLKWHVFDSSLYHHLAHEAELLFANAFIWTHVIGELQCALNTYFLLPLLRSSYFEIGFKGKDWMKAAMGLFFGLPTHIGKCMMFRNFSDIQYKDKLMLPGFCDANRALFVTRNKRKIWVVNCHLTASAQNSFNNNCLQTQLMLKWMNDALCREVNADLIVICGDFNASPNSDVYDTMLEHGYHSCLCDMYGKHAYVTYESLSWTYSAHIDDDYGQRLVLDYIWIKTRNEKIKVSMTECRLVGRDAYKQMKHEEKAIRVYPSDHYGVSVTLKISNI